jgi:ABC-type transport system substrate-binding protein
MELTGLKALDKHTVLVPMTKPYGRLIDQLAFWCYLYIVPVGFNPATPNGTGPFKYKSFIPGERSVFVRNDNYWKPGLPYFDLVTIIDFTDSASLQNALTTNVIDAAGGLEGAQIKELIPNSSVKPSPPRQVRSPRSRCALTRRRSMTSTSGRRPGYQ